MNSRAIPTFWHDPALPWLEARAIDDGRAVRYGKHAHDTFSIGLVTGGESIYVNGKSREHVRAGAVVLMNPGDVHACNPLGDTPWAYRMFYVDSRWLAGVQRDVGLHRHDDLQPYVAIVSHAPALSAGLAALYATCTGRHADPLAKQQAAVAFFTGMHDVLQPAVQPTSTPRNEPGAPLRRAAEYIADNCMHALTLDDICAAAGLSPSYLIRAFKARYGMTPHAWLVNRRIEYCRGLLKRGHPIADAALLAGFADQAHMQRTFKQHVAATPGQYRSRQYAASAPPATPHSPPAAPPSPG
ncbi:AraC-like DNA-binding protein [Pseudoduganella flava]|uniref:AraC-like DNA-binding protein n=1 Tax=Pseudoduganella flava TaxID=871742 RepID=A0A562Q123_9BURK|nr:AraC family transcriptional regulator [Pseudoduganella flava]QGZ38127.1 helix-turn-helix domain-containing protein [Pseudoduganella flava]TWI50357.1 AraC-like DNA-binding protein [Pseudoduganella flava]